MIRRPLGWPLIVRRLARAVPAEALPPILGDLAEDFRADCRRRGRLVAEWRAWRDARSIAGAYRTPRGPLLDGWLFDLRGAARTARREPWLTAAVVLPLALAVSANTAIFSIVDGLLFRPLPFADTHELVSLQVAESSSIGQTYSAYADVIRGLADSPLLAGVSLAGSTQAFSADAATESGLVPSAVSPGFFELLGLPLAAGRGIGPHDDPDARPIAAVLGHDVWHRLFGGDPALVGRVVTLAGRTVHVVGVAAPGLTYPLGSNAWVPAGHPVTPNSLRLWQLARLAPGVSLEQLRRR